MSVFASHAPKYYEKDIPVIPLHRNDKRPIFRDWSSYAEILPSKDEQNNWIQHYTNANIGLVTGPASGVCFADIDAESPAIIEKITEILDQCAGKASPWKRVGKKGMVLAYKYSGLPNFRIKDVSGNTLVEILSYKTQVVLPPSIHPDTRRPYEANCDLPDVIDELPALNSQVEGMLRGMLQEDMEIELSHSGWTKVTDWTPSGSRDTQMTAVAGHYAHGVTKGELPLLEAIERVKAWHSACMEQVAGDDVPVEKGVDKVIEFIHRDVVEKGKQLPKGWDEGLTEEDMKKLGLDFNGDYEEWSFDETKEYLRENFEKHDVASSQFWLAVDRSLKKIATSTSFSSIDQDRMFRYISDVSKKQVTVPQLRKRMQEFAKGEIEGTDHTEIAKAVISDLDKYGELRFTEEKWFVWGGSSWQTFYYDKEGNCVDIENAILRHIASEYGSLSAAKKYPDHRGIINTMKSLVPSYLTTTHLPGINFANGVLPQDRNLKEHSSEYGFTYTLPYRYMPEKASEMRMFNEFIQRIWGDDDDYEEKRAALQEAICATLFGISSKFQRAFLLHGAPKSGKSTLLEMVQRLMPDSARCTVPPDSWNDKFQPAMMDKTLINVCGELSEKNAINGQKFKSIVDGEEQNGQLKGRQIFRFYPICAHWFASNHLPKTEDTSSAFNRRWLILDFNNPIKDGERRLNLGNDIIAEEREAIVAWAVQAIDRLIDNREYTLPASHKQLIEEVAVRNNSVRFFLQQSGMVRRTSKGESATPEGTLHNAYFSFCCGAGAARPVGPQSFRAKMRELAAELEFQPRMTYTDDGSAYFVYDGITLVDKKAA